ncbi:MAG: TonB-dependent receptor, partial [Bacteroidetes bacterium]|nr:TonB-dependent receptor [Bacteroidota bacterium]
NLQETRTSVNVVGEKELDAVPVRDWEDAMELVGNVSTSGNGVFTIRGIPNTGVGGGGSGPTAALYVDGVQQGRFTTSRTIRGAWDLAAIEVFRGPQSTLSGRNALAGAVYLRSAPPSFEYGAAARVRGGTNEALEGAFMVTGPIVEDELALRISGETGTQETDVDYLNVTQGDGFDRVTSPEQRNVKSRLLFTPTALPGLSVLGNYTYAFDRPANNASVTTVPDEDGDVDFSDRENSAPFALFDETTLHNLSLDASYDVNSDLTLTSKTGAVFADFFINGLAYQSDDPEVFVPVAQRSNTDDGTFTQELRLNYDTDRTRAVFGGYYGRFTTDRIRNDGGDIFALVQPQIEALVGSAIPPFGILLDSRTNDVTDTRNYAAFGEINHEVVPGLTLTAGLRYDYEEFESSNTSEGIEVTFEGTPPPLAPFEPTIATLITEQLGTEDQAAETEFSALLPKFGATYDLTRDASVGVTVQRGYRSGGAFSLIAVGLNTFDPEYTWNYELALRSRWLDGRLLANANVFYTDWNDQQVAVPLPENPNFSRTVNAGESTLYGGEVELQALPARGLRLYSSLGLTESEFQTFEFQGRDLAGFEFPGAPSTTLAAGAIYDRGTGPFGALNVNYVGEHYSEVGSMMEDGELANDPRLRAGDYTTVDAQLGYTFSFVGNELRLTAFARNLFDVVAVDRAFVSNDRNQPNGIRVDGRLRAPRVVGLSLRVDV